MKIVLCLAVLCCFIGGIVARGCECDRVKECMCKPPNKEVHTVKIKQEGADYPRRRSGKTIYPVRVLKTYRTKDKKTKVKYISVPDGCNQKMEKGDRFIVMGATIRKADNTLMVGKPNSLIRWRKNLSNQVMQFLREGCDD